MNSRISRTLSLFAVSTLLVAATQSPTTQVQQKKGATGFVLDAGEHELTDVIDKAAKFLGKNFLYVPQEMVSAGAINLQKRIVLDARGCEEVVSQLAESRGVIMTPVDPDRGIWEFVATNGPRRHLVHQRSLQLSPEEVLRRPQLKIRITTALRLKHVASNQSHALRAMFNTSGRATTSLSPMGERGVIISGFAEEVAKILRLIERLDHEENAARDRLQAGHPRLAHIEQQIPAIKKRLTRIEKELSLRLKRTKK